jgi:hypothetical protein
MKFVNDIGFWLTAILCITTIFVLVSSVKRPGKGLLLGFLALSLLSYTGNYVPSLLLRSEVMTNETYRKFMTSAGVVFQILRLAGWAFLLAFVFSLRTEEPSTMPSTGASAAAGSMSLPSLDSPYKGYGGWLAFFGAVQLFVQPIIAVIMLAIGAETVIKVSSKYPGFIGIYSLETLGSIAVVGLGMYAVIKLRSIRPGAVRTTKLYLLVALGWSILSFVLPYLGNIPETAREAMTIENIKGFVKTVIPFSIWFIYFNVSKRVKATYID